MQYVLPHLVVLTFELVDEILKCDSNCYSIAKPGGFCYCCFFYFSKGRRNPNLSLPGAWQRRMQLQGSFAKHRLTRKKGFGEGKLHTEIQRYIIDHY